MTSTFETDLSIGKSAIEAYARMSYTMWYALAEFVDNSTQSRINEGSVIEDVLDAEGVPLTVDIIHDRIARTLTIEDNSIGMTREELVNALKIATPTVKSVGRSKYGMGMKTAAIWIGRKWSIVTCQWDSGEEWTADIDVHGIAQEGASVPLTMRKVDKNLHYTKIIIRDMRRIIQKRSEEVIRQYLGAMYMFDLRADPETNKVTLKLTYDGEEIPPHDIQAWDTDRDGKPMVTTLPEFDIDGRKVNGWIGVLKKGGRKFGGFSLYQNSRQIEGFPSAWKPKAIFGGVDDEGANNLVAQRLMGVLLLDGFQVSHTKDKVQFEGDEEERLEAFLLEQTKDYSDYAKKRRNTATSGPRWTKEKVRELVEGMKNEFTSSEMKDALNNMALPPPEVLAQNNKKQVASVTRDDEIARFKILADLTVVISVKERSEYEPYVVYDTGAEAGIIHIVINGLHPYYQSLETTDAADECIRQYVFDAVAEYKTGRLTSKMAPDSVRNIKNGLLIARVNQTENAEAGERERAAEELRATQPPLS